MPPLIYLDPTAIWKDHKNQTTYVKTRSTALKSYRPTPQMQIKEAQGKLGTANQLSTAGTFHTERIKGLLTHSGTITITKIITNTGIKTAA